MTREARAPQTAPGPNQSNHLSHGMGRPDLLHGERKHAALLGECFPEELTDKTLISLNIPDDYQFMDQALIEQLRGELTAHLEL